jgi:hypothetical protein
LVRELQAQPSKGQASHAQTGLKAVPAATGDSNSGIEPESWPWHREPSTRRSPSCTQWRQTIRPLTPRSADAWPTQVRHKTRC